MIKPPPLRIFVVENHVDTLKWLQIYLEECGHTIQTASTIADALVQFPDSNSQVLMIDIGLADGTGWELLDKLQPSGNVFCIAMSGFGVNANSMHNRESGFHHYLMKPFKPSELERILNEACKAPFSKAV